MFSLHSITMNYNQQKVKAFFSLFAPAEDPIFPILKAISEL